MKKLFISVFLLFCMVAAKAQQDIPGVPDLTKTWAILATKTYKENAKGHLLPVFPPSMQALEGKTVELPGFMIPVKTGLLHTMFFVSVLPIYQCDFCGLYGIPSMVEVHTLKGVPFNDGTIVVRGKIHLNTSDNYDISEVFLLDAEMVK